MSPADGGFYVTTVEGQTLAPDLAIILPEGRTLLALSHLECELPRHGLCGDAPWRALCWPALDGRAGLALVEAPLVNIAALRVPGAAHDIASPRTIDVAPAPLAEFIRRNGLTNRDVLDFLIDAVGGSSAGNRQVQGRDFVGGFLSLVAEADGYVEILACPDTGGLFAQGWAMSLAAGRNHLARIDGTLELCEADVAVFTRADIPPPGMGFCLFSFAWRNADLDRLDYLVFEKDGTLKRLEIVRETVLKLQDEAATGHVRQMLPRLASDEDVIGSHRRICRPRYRGADTLSSTPLPVAAGFDAVYETPSGGLLAIGWLLDPLSRVERVIIKSKDGLYAPLHDRWLPLARRDLHDGFAHDPRFVRRLDPANDAHGFVAFAPGKPRQATDDLYVELVLDDGTCLFRPLSVVRLGGRELVPQILAALPLHDPALAVCLEDIVAPFLAELPTRPHRPLIGQRPIPLSSEVGEITAVIPLDRLDHLQPMMALLAGTTEADRLDLVVVMAQGEAREAAARLKDLFAFYRLKGRLMLVADGASRSTRMDAGLDLAQGSRILLWSASALPSTPGWLGLLEAELEALGRPGLISPTLIYEDGSVFYGGDGATSGDDAPMLGYPRGWLMRGAPRPMPSCAVQLAFIDREALAKAGGFNGRLYSDALLHRDLSHRLHAHGFGTWASRSVDFWMLDDPAGPSDAAMAFLERVDSALLDNMAAAATGG